MHQLARSLLFVACMWVTAATAAQPDATKPLILGIHPYLPHDEIVSRFTPLANYLAKAIGRPVTVRVGRDYNEHVEAIGDDNIDIAYMGPAPYVQMVAKYGRKPLLARQVINDSPFLKGEIVVRQDSKLGSLKELKGRNFCFGDNNSTMSSVLPRRMLEDAGVPLTRLGSYKHLEGHKNVALAVLAGNCDAGAVKSEVFQEFQSRGLRVLAEMPPVADHVFVANAKLPGPLVRKLRTAMLALNTQPEGKPILNGIHPDMTALVAPKDSDYDSLRTLLKIASSSTSRPH
ncbi:putative ABC transporter phosphonate/phosphite binding protein PhnD2 [Sideroxyarcus emersonii]|uniref:ABC transporter phosphonate/phosphite binding protein PhnD2 n=1 Tax=Sideroxyarcus emersonii TaxID=2764705 RepID=A0AAN2BZJ0_9PROT|nr:phosphate/phosphite/phosphonate ABC transporter substrate-binding protein [Sideroxyarcus emersonii]BCK87847.1 putative ABC transporter phosphonate/phosphite binding protein PhnD2 [Sideroxyarcus emersonii]